MHPEKDSSRNWLLTLVIKIMCLCTITIEIISANSNDIFLLPLNLPSFSQVNPGKLFFNELEDQKETVGSPQGKGLAGPKTGHAN